MTLNNEWALWKQSYLKISKCVCFVCTCRRLIRASERYKLAIVYPTGHIWFGVRVDGRGRGLGRARKRFDFSSVPWAAVNKDTFTKWSTCEQFSLSYFCFCLSVCLLGQFRNMLLTCSPAMLRTVQSTRSPTEKWELGKKNSILDFNALQLRMRWDALEN